MSTDNGNPPDTGTGNSGIFPNEIVSEILTRLPAKYVHRFKCVSKTWNSITSTPHFISSYITHNSPSSSWVFLDRVIQLTTELTQPPTRFNLLERPKVSSLSVNPYSLLPGLLTDPTHKKCPAIIFGSNHGLLLIGISEKDPYKVYAVNPRNNFAHIRDVDEFTLFVTNPVTNEWVPLPELSPSSICRRPAVGFLAKLDSCGVVDNFLVVEYQPFIGTHAAHLLCFSSNIRKWVEIDANYMLGRDLWRNDGVFEFGGHFVWYDYSSGLIVWDQDPFAFVDGNKNNAVLRYVTLPSGCVKPFSTPGLEDERSIDVSRGCIQFLEMFKEGDFVFKVWRLEDFAFASGGWNLVYKVSRADFERCLLNKDSVPKPCLLHPFDADTVFIDTVARCFNFNFRTQKSKTFGSFTGHQYVIPFVLPSWPTSLPPRFCAAHAKEKGNEYFKDKKFAEAVTSYSRSISLWPNAFAYANRALAYLKLNDFRKAEEDCTEALKLDSEYVKGYGRRALARKELGDLKGCMEDIEYALKLEPENQEMKKLHAELKILLEN